MNRDDGAVRALRSWVYQVVACAVVFSVCAESAPALQVGAVASSEPTDVVAALRTRLPAEGVVECELTRDDDLTFHVFGYDLRTGSWYAVRYGIGRARLADGSLHVSPGGDARYRRPMDKPVGREYFLERRVMPFVWLRHIIDNPDSIVDSGREPDGDLFLEMEAPGGDPLLEPDANGWPPPMRYRLSIDEDGRLLRSERVGVNETFGIKYLGEAAPGYPVGISEEGQWQLLRAVVHRGEDAPVFTAEYVDAIAARVQRQQGEARFERARAAATPREAADGDGAPPDSKSEAPRGRVVGVSPTQRSALSRVATPVVTAGILLLGVGVFLWWRYRR